MQTTLRFDEALMRRVKAEAAHQGISLTRYIEAALRERLHRSRQPKRKGTTKFKLPVSRAKGGFAAGIRDLKQAFAIVADEEAAALIGNQK